MKFTVDTKKLLEALSKINKIVAAKSDIPVYQDVLIEAKDKKVYLTGSNTVSRIRVTLPLAINAFDEGQCCVPASLLFDLVKTLDVTEVTLGFDEDKQILVINTSLKNSSFKLNCDMLSYPEWKSFNPTDKLRIEMSSFLKLIKETGYAAAPEKDHRNILKGVKLSFSPKETVAIATDAYRASRAVLDKGYVEKDTTFVLPVIGFKYLPSLFELDDTVEIQAADNLIQFSDSSTVFITRTLEGNYPDRIDLMFKDHPESVSFDIKIQELTKLLNRASVLTKHSSVPLLTFSFDTQNESVELATKKVTTGNIKEELPIDKFVASGNGYTICFNINYLLQVLRFSYDSKAKKIHFSFNDALRYFTITDADNPNSGLCQIICPVDAA